VSRAGCAPIWPALTEAAWLGALVFAAVWLGAMAAWWSTFGGATCSTDGCHVVQASPLARPLGVPLSAWGAGLSLATVLAGLSALRRGVSPFLDPWTAGGQALGVLGALASTSYSLLVLRAACGHCLVASTTLTGAGLVYGLAALSGSPAFELRARRPVAPFGLAIALACLVASAHWLAALRLSFQVDRAVEALALPEALGPDGVVWGSARAPSQVLAFIDPLCEVCIGFLESQEPLIRCGRLRMRILAASVHGTSDAGALMVCAHRSGRFTEFVRDLAEALRTEGDVRPWIVRRARETDPAELERARRIARRQEELAKRLGIVETPTVYLLSDNGRPRRIPNTLP